MRALVLAALFPSAALAAPAIPAVTGETFVRDMLAAADGGPASMRRERAIGYMDGVMDATSGARWCPAGRQVAHELSYVAAEEMKRLPPDQLKGNAAPLALSVLARFYPCAAKGGKP